MKQGTMRFRNYIFPSNPHTIEISDSRTLKKISLPLLGETVQDLGKSVQRMKGSGTFIGNNAYADYLELQKEYEKGGTGILSVPGFQPICAVFSSLRLTAPPEPDTAEYAFEFIQKHTQVLREHVPEDYCMGAGESLWDVAAKFGISIDRLMEYNAQYPDPFSPLAGERVRLC